MSADSKLENIMLIDKMLHEKHLGLLWQTFQSKPCRRQRWPLKQQSDRHTNELQSIQSARKMIEMLLLKCINAFKLLLFFFTSQIKIHQKRLKIRSL